MKKYIYKGILILFVVLLLLLQCGCKDDSINTEIIENEKIEENEEIEENKVFSNLSINFEDANEPYYIIIKNDDNYNNSSAEVKGKDFMNIRGKELIKCVSTSADWGEEWDSSYDINTGISRESIIIISPVSELIQRPYLDLRKFTINYFDFILQIASKNFSQIAFDYYDKMLLENNLGEFAFLYYPFDSLEYFDNYDYYKVSIYGKTEDKSNILITFDKEKQEFTLTAGNNISNLRIETTLKGNSCVETVCDESVIGTDLTITINEEYKANVVVNK